MTAYSPRPVEPPKSIIVPDEGALFSAAHASEANRQVPGTQMNTLRDPSSSMGRSKSTSVTINESEEHDTIVVEHPEDPVNSSTTDHNAAENSLSTEINDLDSDSDSDLSVLSNSPEPGHFNEHRSPKPEPQPEPKWLKFSKQGGCPHGMIPTLWIFPQTMPFPEPCKTCIPESQKLLFRAYMLQQRKEWMRKVKIDIRRGIFRRVPGEKFCVERMYMGCGQGWHLRIVQIVPDRENEDENERREQRLKARKARKARRAKTRGVR